MLATAEQASGSGTLARSSAQPAGGRGGWESEGEKERERKGHCGIRLLKGSRGGTTLQEKLEVGQPGVSSRLWEECEGEKLENAPIYELSVLIRIRVPFERQECLVPSQSPEGEFELFGRRMGKYF